MVYFSLRKGWMPNRNSLDYAEIRRLVIVAFFSDDTLVEKLVLKGGNALNLIYGVSSRSSLDLDFSLNGDFSDFTETRERLFRVLRDRFDSAGYVVFDEKLEPKPRIEGKDQQPWWGGYELKFKLIEKEKYETLKNRPEKMRIDAAVIGPQQLRTFTADFSKYEYTEGKIKKQLNYYTIYVYTPEMIVAEKLRAICQQMPEYREGYGVARARDFYDIYLVVKEMKIDLTTSENCDLLRNVFAAKRVPLSLLNRISEQLEFHRPDWPAVVASAIGPLQSFDFYFKFVTDQVELLKALWYEETPV
jgi:hypothetical protein